MSMKWSVPILVVLLSLMASSALSMRLMGDDDLINPLEPRRQIEPWRIEHCRQLCQGHRHPRKCEEECEKINGFDDESSKEVDTRSRDPHQEFRQCRRRCQTQQEGGRQQRKCEQRCEKQLERQQGYDDEEFGQGRSNIGAPVRSNDRCQEECGYNPMCMLFC